MVLYCTTLRFPPPIKIIYANKGWLFVRKDENVSLYFVFVANLQCASVSLVSSQQFFFFVKNIFICYVSANRPINFNLQQFNVNNSEITKLHIGDVLQEQTTPKAFQGTDSSKKFHFIPKLLFKTFVTTFFCSHALKKIQIKNGVNLIRLNVTEILFSNFFIGICRSIASTDIKIFCFETFFFNSADFVQLF